MADGSLIFETRIDTSGMEKGRQSVRVIAKNMSETIRNAGNEISAVLNDNVSASIENVGAQLKEAAEDIGTEVHKAADEVEKQAQEIADKSSDVNDIIRSDSTKTSKHVEDNAKSSADKAENYYQRMGDNVSSIFLKMGMILTAVFSLAELKQLGEEAIELASDLEEVQNVVDTAFGSMSYKMESFASACLKTYGISKLAAKQMGSTFMAMSTGMGQAAEVASDKAVEITGRLADIMSFYNKTISEAETIGRAVYSGETEPLKAIGIIMTEANLNAYALAEGYETLYSEMEAQDKLFIRQQFFLERTSLAAGDFTKTQDSWANQTRILSEQWKEFLSICGTGLIEVLTPAVKSLNMLLESMINIGNTAASVFGWGNKLVSIGESSEGAGEAVEDMAAATTAAGKKVNRGLAPFDDLNVIAGQIADNAESSAKSLGELGSTSTSITVEEVNTDSRLAEDLRDVGETLSSFATAISKFGGSAAKGFIESFMKLGKVTWNTVAKGLNAVSDFLGAVSPEEAEGIGAGLAGMAKAILAINGAKLVAGIISNLATSISSLGPAGVLVDVGVALVGIAEGAAAYREAMEEKFETELFGDTVDNLIEKYTGIIDEINTSINEMHTTVENAGAGEITYVQKLWEEYQKLETQSNKTNTEIERMKTVGQTLSEYIPEFNEIIGSETLAWEEQKKAIDKLIEQKELMYKINAAKSLIEEAYALQIMAQKDFDEAQEKIAKAVEDRNNAWIKYIELQKKADDISIRNTAEQDKFAAQAAEAYTEWNLCNQKIEELMPTVSELESALAAATENSQWLFDYIASAEASLVEITEDNAESIENALVDGVTEAAEKSGEKMEELKTFTEETLGEISTTTAEKAEEIKTSLVDGVTEGTETSNAKVLAFKESVMAELDRASAYTKQKGEEIMHSLI